MTVLACISSILFAMHLHDKIGAVMPTRFMLIVHSCTEISEQFPIDRYKYIHDSAMRTTFASPSQRQHPLIFFSPHRAFIRLIQTANTLPMGCPILPAAPKPCFELE